MVMAVTSLLSLRNPVRKVVPQWVEAISHTAGDTEEDCHAMAVV
jgi:hypothetical protein